MKVKYTYEKGCQQLFGVRFHFFLHTWTILFLMWFWFMTGALRCKDNTKCLGFLRQKTRKCNEVVPTKSQNVRAVCLGWFTKPVLNWLDGGHRNVSILINLVFVKDNHHQFLGGSSSSSHRQCWVSQLSRRAPEGRFPWRSRQVACYPSLQRPEPTRGEGFAISL